MKKIMIGFTVLAVMSVIVGISLAQSDYATRTGYTPAKAPQSTVANIHAREGMIVGHYIYDIDGAVTEDVAMNIKEGIGNVTIPANAIILANSAIIDITTAGPTACTGTVAIGTTTIFSGSMASTGVKSSSFAVTRTTADNLLKFTVTDNVPTSSMSVSVYIPYVLGN